MATFSGQGLLEILTNLGWSVEMVDKNKYRAIKHGYKEIKYTESRREIVESIKVLNKSFGDDLDKALEYAKNGGN